MGVTRGSARSGSWNPVDFRRGSSPPTRWKDVTMTAIREHDRVVLTEDLPAEHLFMGDVGTVVHVYAKAAAYEVEFVSPEGRTIAVVTLDQSKVRQAGRGDASRAGHVA
jgi:Domain of unknown function (DUF4926)